MAHFQLKKVEWLNGIWETDETDQTLLCSYLSAWVACATNWWSLQLTFCHVIDRGKESDSVIGAFRKIFADTACFALRSNDSGGPTSASGVLPTDLDFDSYSGIYKLRFWHHCQVFASQMSTTTSSPTPSKSNPLASFYRDPRFRSAVSRATQLKVRQLIEAGSLRPGRPDRECRGNWKPRYGCR